MNTRTSKAPSRSNPLAGLHPLLLVLEIVGTLLLAFGVFLWASGGGVIPMAPAQARGLGIALGVLGLLLTVPFTVAIIRRAARRQREQRRNGTR